MSDLECDVCHKQWKNRTALKTHKLIHLPDSEKPFQCETCDKRFCQSVQRRVHIEKYHPEAMNNEETGEEVQEDENVVFEMDEGVEENVDILADPLI